MQKTRTTLTLAAYGALALLAHPAHAALVIEADPSTALAGGNGTFDVDLLDTDTPGPGSTPYQVGGFSFKLSVPSDSGVMFTGADTDTTSAPYIFGTLQSPPFSFNTFPNTDFIASDSDFAAPYVAVGPGDTFSLGHISYSVAPGTALGPVAVHFEDIGGGTFLSDGDLNAIPFTTQDGTIIVANASPTPEPSEVGMLALAACGLGWLLLRARRRSPA